MLLKYRRRTKLGTELRTRQPWQEQRQPIERFFALSFKASLSPFFLPYSLRSGLCPEFCPLTVSFACWAIHSSLIITSCRVTVVVCAGFCASANFGEQERSKFVRKVLKKEKDYVIGNVRNFRKCGLWHSPLSVLDFSIKLSLEFALLLAEICAETANILP